MKTAYIDLRLIVTLLSLIFLFSCSMRVHYLGETYPAKTETDVFYDEKDIANEYKTIGHLLSREFTIGATIEQRQSEMIEEAKRRGADAIVFDPFEALAEPGGANDLRLQARLVRYTD